MVVAFGVVTALRREKQAFGGSFSLPHGQHLDAIHPGVSDQGRRLFRDLVRDGVENGRQLAPDRQLRLRQTLPQALGFRRLRHQLWIIDALAIVVDHTRLRGGPGRTIGEVDVPGSSDVGAIDVAPDLLD